MTQEQIFGLVRHILTALGGVLVTKGIIDEGTLTQVVGALVTIGAVVWSFLAKKKAV